MPKAKTISAVKKRFKITASGKAKYKRAGKRHNLGHRKSAGRKLSLRKGSYAHSSASTYLHRALPYAF